MNKCVPGSPWPLIERALVVLSLSGQMTSMCALEAGYFMFYELFLHCCTVVALLKSLNVVTEIHAYRLPRTETAAVGDYRRGRCHNTRVMAADGPYFTSP